VPLGEPPPVREPILRFTEFRRICAHILERGHEPEVLRDVLPDDARSPDSLKPFARVEPPGDLDHLFLSRAVDQDVGPRVKKDAPPHGVVPVIVVGKASQRGLDPADDRHRSREEGSDLVAVDEDGPVGDSRAEGPVRVLGPAALESRVVREQAVDRTRGDSKKETRPAELDEVGIAFPLWLADDADLEPLGLEHAGDDADAGQRMVGIDFAADKDDVETRSSLGNHGDQTRPYYIAGKAPRSVPTFI
jgi:hypothetical protein